MAARPYPLTYAVAFAGGGAKDVTQRCARGAARPFGGAAALSWRAAGGLTANGNAARRTRDRGLLAWEDAPAAWAPACGGSPSPLHVATFAHLLPRAAGRYTSNWVAADRRRDSEWWEATLRPLRALEVARCLPGGRAAEAQAGSSSAATGGRTAAKVSAPGCRRRLCLCCCRRSHGLGQPARWSLPDARMPPLVP